MRQEDLLDIPEFLKRPGREDGAGFKEVKTNKKKQVPGFPAGFRKKYFPYSKNPPKHMADARKVYLWLGNEAPRIGFGYRTMWASQKKKWTYLSDTMGNRGKMLTSIFEKKKKKWVEGYR